MKSVRRFTLILFVASFFVNGCSSDRSNSGGKDSTATADSSASAQEAPTPDPDVTDTISTASYVANSANVASADLIRKVLPAILEKQLIGADSAARRFVYYQTDLNGDGKDEFFVGFTGMNWCGSGGCTALLLSNEGKLLTYFTVVDFPFSILSDKTNGWKDLVVYSGSSDRLLKWNGSRYPANPSIAPKYKGKAADEAEKALAFSEKPYPWFTF